MGEAFIRQRETKEMTTMNRCMIEIACAQIERAHVAIIELGLPIKAVVPPMN